MFLLVYRQLVTGNQVPNMEITAIWQYHAEAWDETAKLLIFDPRAEEKSNYL